MTIPSKIKTYDQAITYSPFYKEYDPYKQYHLVRDQRKTNPQTNKHMIVASGLNKEQAITYTIQKANHFISNKK